MPWSWIGGALFGLLSLFLILWPWLFPSRRQRRIARREEDAAAGYFQTVEEIASEYRTGKLDAPDYRAATLRYALQAANAVLQEAERRGESVPSQLDPAWIASVDAAVAAREAVDATETAPQGPSGGEPPAEASSQNQKAGAQ
ncbi:MAG: hypothetical protein IMW91_10550 [Firmicutes bacterium]|nr:hypothetical protein [Bacillota bacterium]